MTAYQKILIGYILAINIIAYLVMCFDKYQSKKKGKRVSENTLFFMAFIFGSLGIYLGMKAPIYHKAAKAKFKYGIPFFIVINVLAFYVMYEHLK